MLRTLNGSVFLLLRWYIWMTIKNFCSVFLAALTTPRSRCEIPIQTSFFNKQQQQKGRCFHSEAFNEFHHSPSPWDHLNLDLPQIINDKQHDISIYRPHWSHWECAVVYFERLFCDFDETRPLHWKIAASYISHQSGLLSLCHRIVLILLPNWLCRGIHCSQHQCWNLRHLVDSVTLNLEGSQVPLNAKWCLGLVIIRDCTVIQLMKQHRTDFYWRKGRNKRSAWWP